MNKENDSLGMNTNELKQKLQENTEEEIFQQTTHIKEMIVDSNFEPNYANKTNKNFHYLKF